MTTANGNMEEAIARERAEIVEGRSYTYDSAIAWPEYMKGARVLVTKIYEGDGPFDLTVAYDFRSQGGTTGSGTMHIDHARACLKPTGSPWREVDAVLQTAVKG